MYRVETIGGIFDGGAPLPLDPSWLPPELRDRKVLPDGTPIVPVPAPAPAPSSGAAPIVVAVVGGALGLALGFALFGR